MSYWSKSAAKTMRRVGAVWLDPVSVVAAEEMPSSVARFHLHSGAVVETSIPQGKSLDWMMAKLFKEDK